MPPWGKSRAWTTVIRQLDRIFENFRKTRFCRDTVSTLRGGRQRRCVAFDQLIAISLLCVGSAFVLVLVLMKHYAVQLPAILAISCLSYLLLRQRLSEKGTVRESRANNLRNIRPILHIVFVAALSLSTWVLWSNLYYRPPSYFILLLIAAASIVVETGSVDNDRTSDIVVALFKMIVLDLSIYAGIYYEYPGVYGVDPWWHVQWIEETVSLGHVAPGIFHANGYYLFPVFHLLGAVTHELTGLSVYSSIFASVGAFMAVSSIFVFLICRKLADTRVGLLAAFVVPLTAEYIQRSTATIPISLGFCFFLMILYFILCRERKALSDSLLTLLLSVTGILTHTIAALVIVVSLIAAQVGVKTHRQIDRPATAHSLVSLTLIAFVAIAMLTRWMQVPAAPGIPAVFDTSLKQLMYALRAQVELLSASPASGANVPYSVSLVDQGGYLVLLAMGIIGALVYLRPDYRTGSRMALVSVAGMLFVIPYSFIVFRVETILPSRWTLFFSVPLSVLAMQALSSMSSILKYTSLKLGTMTLVLLAIVFMTLTGSIANNDSPWVYNGAIRSGYTQSELTAIVTLSEIGGASPKTDLYYGLIFPYVMGYDKYMSKASESQAIFVQRNYYLRHPDWNMKYRGQLLREENAGYVQILAYMKEHGLNRWPLAYANGNVNVYLVASRD